MTAARRILLKNSCFRCGEKILCREFDFELFPNVRDLRGSYAPNARYAAVISFCSSLAINRIAITAQMATFKVQRAFIASSQSAHSVRE